MDDFEFRLTGTVKYRPAGIGLKIETAPKGRQQYGTVHEILCFKSEAKGLEVGDLVTVTGEIGTKKSEYTREYNGKIYPVYLTQLIGRKVVKDGAFKQPELPPPDDSDIPF